MLILNPPSVSTENGKARISCRVSGALDYDLWFAVDEAYADLFETNVLDGFVLAVLVRAMMLGEDMQLQAPMSSRLYYNLSNYVMPILRILYPAAHEIRIHPASLHTVSQAAKGVLTGFSGGIDSFCAYADHSGGRSPTEYAVTHFLYNNVGSHGQRGTEHDRGIFARRGAFLKQFAGGEGKPFIAVDSNLDEIIAMDFELTHTIRNVAVAMLMQNAIGKYLYASGVSYPDLQVKASHDIAFIDALIVPLLQTERLECILSGAQHSRVEKTIRVAALETSRTYLDVCVEPTNATGGRTNCSRCFKCLRTALTLEIIGKLQDYEGVFDIPLYRAYKNIYLLETLSSSRPMQIEIRKFIKARRFPVPRMVRASALLLPEACTRHITRWLIPRLMHRPDLKKNIDAVLAF